MRKLKKIVNIVLVAAMLFLYVPVLECHAAGETDYMTAKELEFDKLYVLSIKAKDENTEEWSYEWYKFTPRADMKVKLEYTNLTNSILEVSIFDQWLTDMPYEYSATGKILELEKNTTYYLRIYSLDRGNSSLRSDTEISLVLKSLSIAAGDNTGNGGDNSSLDIPDQSTGGPTGTKPGTDSSNTNTGDKPGIGSDNTGKDDSSNAGDVNSDFWNEGNNGSDVYNKELPVPEITEVENGSQMVNISWSCDDAGNIDGYYIYRSKDGKSWDKIATIKDAEVKDYEDLDIANGDACGYIVCTYSGEEKSENSVPEYTYFLKKITIKSVKSNASEKLNVKWNANLKSTGYQVRVSTTKSFTKTTTKSTRVDSKTISSKTIGRLKSGKKYYVQVQAYRNYNGEVYYSEWSATKSIKVRK